MHEWSMSITLDGETIEAKRTTRTIGTADPTLTVTWVGESNGIKFSLTEFQGVIVGEYNGGRADEQTTSAIHGGLEVMYRIFAYFESDEEDPMDRPEWYI